MARQKVNGSKVATIAIIFAVAIFVWWAVCQITKPPVIYQFELAEISDGVYAYREVVESSIPAQNYTMATVCDKSGNIFTIKGTVNIVSQSDTEPYAVWEDWNIVNADVITIYAPLNTIEYLGAVASRK